MARNSEKAMQFLNRWQAAKHAITYGSEDVMPKNPFSVTSLAEAERWRADVIRELLDKLVRIQDGNVGAKKLAELNAHVNKLVRLKHAWNAQVTKLGGFPLRAEHELEKDFVLTTDGVRWFGAAKALPTVQQQLQPPDPGGPPPQLAALRKRLDCAYFGFCDEKIVPDLARLEFSSAPTN